MSIPVFIVTGFLGSGKTTLLNRLLSDPAFSDSAVLINEFGDVQVDHDLVAEFSDELLTTTTGCLCCTASSDIKQSLFDIWRRRKDREIGPFRRVIVETTGLIDPAPIINSLLSPHAPGLVDNIVKNQFVLSQVVTTFDLVNGMSSLKRFTEAQRQLGFADVVLLTMADLSPDPQAAKQALRARLTTLNPSADILDRRDDWPKLREAFLSQDAYDLRHKGEDALAWLAAERLHEQPHDPSHDHTHDTNRHGDDIQSHVIITDRPISQAGLRRFLTDMKSKGEQGLLRMKGLVAVREDPEKPVVVHGVQHLAHPISQLDRWPSEDRRTRIVLIGMGLDVEAFREALLAEASAPKTGPN